MGIEEFIIPELLVLVPVLYVLGYFLKQSELMDAKYIPLVLILAGIILALFWEFAQKGFGFESFFAGITQGILCAGAAVLGNQIYKQLKKE